MSILADILKICKKGDLSELVGAYCSISEIFGILMDFAYYLSASTRKVHAHPQIMSTIVYNGIGIHVSKHKVQIWI